MQQKRRAAGATGGGINRAATAARARRRGVNVTILDAMLDPALFGPWFRDRTSWRAWEAFLAGLFGLPLGGESAAALFSKHTGHTVAPVGPVRETGRTGAFARRRIGRGADQRGLACATTPSGPL